MRASPSPFDAFDVPPPWPRPLLKGIRTRYEASPFPIVILDDDPLGGQCVRDIPVLTTWDPKWLAVEMDRSEAFLLLTDTRALGRRDAVERAREIGFSLQQAALEAAVQPTLMWRSDSTLRGHFFWEMIALTEEFELDGLPDPVYVFLPYFGDGGRYTLDDVQHVLQEGRLVPVAETEFARDPAFAFTQSHLPAWLEEHSEGQVRARDVLTLSLEDLRRGGPERVATALADAPGGSAVIVNAIADSDIEVFVAGLQRAEAEGGYFLCSGAAPFVRARLGQAVRPVLAASDLNLAPDAGGLIIVGSYVDRTSEQLRLALAVPGAISIELAVDALTDATRRASEVQRIARSVSGHLGAGEDVIVHTTRAHVPGAAPAIAEALRAVVEGLDVRPRYLLAKGGSTASDIATEALGVRRAVVLGQLMAGVPVWRLDEESRWPGLPFVIFPGNVGTSEGLAEALRLLRGS
jgi:uncharacterized protein YgbK (DUF1537 family)